MKDFKFSKYLILYLPFFSAWISLSVMVRVSGSKLWSSRSSSLSRRFFSLSSSSKELILDSPLQLLLCHLELAGLISLLVDGFRRFLFVISRCDSIDSWVREWSEIESVAVSVRTLFAGG